MKVIYELKTSLLVHRIIYMISGPKEPKTAERASILQSKILTEILICIIRLTHNKVVMRPVSERIVGQRD